LTGRGYFNRPGRKFEKAHGAPRAILPSCVSIAARSSYFSRARLRSGRVNCAADVRLIPRTPDQRIGRNRRDAVDETANRETMEREISGEILAYLASLLEISLANILPRLPPDRLLSQSRTRNCMRKRNGVSPWLVRMHVMSLVSCIVAAVGRSSRDFIPFPRVSSSDAPCSRERETRETRNERSGIHGRRVRITRVIAGGRRSRTRERRRVNTRTRLTGCWSLREARLRIRVETRRDLARPSLSDARARESAARWRSESVGRVDPSSTSDIRSDQGFGTGS